MGIQLADEPAAAPATGSPSPRHQRATPAAALLAVIALTAVGVVVRAVVANQSIFADELSTYWISATHSLGGVVSLMYGTPHIQHAEITPPMYFLAAWLTTQFGHSVVWLRLPSLLAGVVTIPLVYLLGRRLVGRSTALVATALTAFSPFMIYYSGEARSYALMMALVLGSTLSMLLALDTRRARWWVLYAACSWGAFLTHYTSAFVLAAQFVWLLWAHPEGRRSALIANLGAAAAMLPWLPGLIQDFRSPTLKILSVLSPFNPHEIWLIVEHWTVGYPYEFGGGLSRLPGTVALILLAASVIVAVGGLAIRARRGTAGPARIDRRLLLTVLLALAVPVGEAIVSLTGDHIFGVRNLAASWPYLALSFAALLMASGARTRLVASGLAIVAFGWGAVTMLSPRFDRPNYQAAANYIAAHARPGDVVLDETGALSPGPLTALDVSLHAPIPVIRAAAPAERGHPFNFLDRIVPVQEGIQAAVARAHGHRVFVIWNDFRTDISQLAQRVAAGLGSVPAPYRVAEQHTWTGIGRTIVDVLAPPGASSQ